MSIHLIFKDPMNTELAEERRYQISDKFYEAGLEIAAIRSISLEDAYSIQIVLFSDDEEKARQVVRELAGESAEKDLYLEHLPDDEDQTENAFTIKK